MKTLLLVLLLAVPARAQMEAVDSWLLTLPENARTDYKLARYGNQGKELQVALRSWMARWLNPLRDPGKALVQLDFVTVICEDAAQFVEAFNDAKSQENVRARATTETVGNVTTTTYERGKVAFPTQTAAEKGERASSLREARQMLQTIRVRTREPYIMAAIAKKQATVESLLKFYER